MHVRHTRKRELEWPVRAGSINKHTPLIQGLGLVCTTGRPGESRFLARALRLPEQTDRRGPRAAIVHVCLEAAAPMNREQLLERLRARVRRGGPAESVWWNGELLHVSEAIARASELPAEEHIQARGDDVLIPRLLEAA